MTKLIDVAPDMDAVKRYFFNLQTKICDAFAKVDGGAEFSIEDVKTDTGGHSRPRVIDAGTYIESSLLYPSDAAAELTRVHSAALRNVEHHMSTLHSFR